MIETRVQVHSDNPKKYSEHPESMKVEEYLSWRKERPRGTKRRLPNRRELGLIMNYRIHPKVNEGTNNQIPISEADIRIIMLKQEELRHPHVRYFSKGEIIKEEPISRY